MKACLDVNETSKEETIRAPKPKRSLEVAPDKRRKQARYEKLLATRSDQEPLG
jgi:hypothetical protein